VTQACLTRGAFGLLQHAPANARLGMALIGIKAIEQNPLY
jgi:hypothetical protein